MTETLISKIAKAALDVGGKLSADRTNKEQSYDYISADKTLSVCGQALFTQGVVVVPQVSSQEINLFEYTDQYGKAKRRYDCRVDFVFKITDGEGHLEELWFGMGSDYSVPDKALYKAITSGHKYFLMKLLCVGAGNEDGEHEAEHEDDGKQAKGKQQPKPAATPQPQPQPAQPQANRVERPLSPEALRDMLHRKAEQTHKGKTASQPQKGLFTGMMDAIFAGDADKRHTVQMFLFGYENTANIPDPLILAALDWLKAEKDSGGAYQPDPMAAREANGAYTAAILDEGQQPLI